MDQVGDHVDHDDERMKRLTIDTLRGLASKIFHKYLETNRNPTWAQIKAVMNNKYCDRADIEYAKQQLKGLKQHSGELVETYADRLQDLADHIYSREEKALPLVAASLVNTFIGGIKDDSIAKYLIKTAPQHLGQAIDIAIRAGQTNKLFQIMRHREEEPMDISIVDKKTKRADGTAVGKLSQDVEQLNDRLDQALIEISEVAKATTAYIDKAEVERSRPQRQEYQPQFNAPPRFPQNQRDARPQYFNTPPIRSQPRQQAHARFPNQLQGQGQQGSGSRQDRTPLRWTEDGRPICAFCSIIGHIRRECRKRQRAQASSSSLNYKSPMSTRQ